MGDRGSVAFEFAGYVHAGHRAVSEKHVQNQQAVRVLHVVQVQYVFIRHNLKSTFRNKKSQGGIDIMQQYVIISL
jgi:hypothetical protein